MEPPRQGQGRSCWEQHKEMSSQSKSQHHTKVENTIQGLYGLKLFLASEPVQKVLSEGCQLFQRKMEQLQTAPVPGLQSNSLAPLAVVTSAQLCPWVWPRRPCLIQDKRFWVTVYPQNRWAFREEEEEGNPEPFLGSDPDCSRETVAGPLLEITLNQKSTLYVASGLQQSCQSMEA